MCALQSVWEALLGFQLPAVQQLRGQWFRRWHRRRRGSNSFRTIGVIKALEEKSPSPSAMLMTKRFRDRARLVCVLEQTAARWNWSLKSVLSGPKIMCVDRDDLTLCLPHVRHRRAQQCRSGMYAESAIS